MRRPSRFKMLSVKERLIARRAVDLARAAVEVETPRLIRAENVLFVDD
jgi:hypothetical protein